jgi:3-hydroxyisobutyrate dehydrogenase-like beta-hydroxyacid dehydrogenase
MGNMGRSFAARALEQDHHVTVWNRSAGRATALVDRGAVEAGSAPAAVRHVDVVLVVLADDAAVLEVGLGQDGILGALGPATVVANISTVSPDTIRRLARAGPEGRILDAPVMGSPGMIAGGQGHFLIGGNRPTITALDGLWRDIGAGYTHCGPVGTAATMKLVSNLLLITGVAALAEGIAIARRQSIPDDLIKSVIMDGSVVSPAGKVRLASLLDAAHPGWFSPSLARKDVRLAIELAQQAGVGVRIGPAAEALLSTVADGDEQWPDFTAVIEALDRPT